MQLKTDRMIATKDNGIGWMIFNNPERRNAMSLVMREAMAEIFETFARDDEVLVLVLRGAGGKAFVAGTDISQFTHFEGADDGLRYERDGDERTGRIARVKKPVIAMIQGFAVGGGFGIAAGADVRIATPDARFGAPIARTLGNCLSMKAYARYVDLVGASRLKEMILTARLLTADEALAAGFVHEVIAADAIEARVAALAQTIASHAPITLWVTKEAVRRIQEARPVPDGDDLIAATYGSDDFREGVRAFVDKRPPRWTGR
jgi:enoyl-CoA hydratase/carnithine racemase